MFISSWMFFGILVFAMLIGSFVLILRDLHKDTKTLRDWILAQGVHIDGEEFGSLDEKINVIIDAKLREFEAKMKR